MMKNPLIDYITKNIGLRFALFMLVCLPAVLTLFLSGCSDPTGNPGGPGTGRPKEIPPVRVAEVTRQSVPLQYFTVGNVEAFATVDIKSQVSGELVAVHFTEGDFVKKDQELFSIDAQPYQVALRQAEAALARSQAQREQASATLQRDRAEAENALREQKRNEPLISQKMISQEEYDQTQTQAQALQASVAADESALKAAEEAIQSAKADIDQAGLYLGYCSIRSPLDGRTGSLLVHGGNLVRANDTTPLVIITQIQPVYVTFTLPEKHLADIRTHMARGPLQVSAAIPGAEGEAPAGTLSFVDSSVDTSTGTIRLKGTFENADQRLWPGQFVTVTLHLSMLENAITAPSEAIQMGQSGYFAYVVRNDSTVEVRNVVPGETLNRLTVIREGLEPGEQVIVDGLLRAAPDAKVQVITEPALSGSDAPATVPEAEKE